MKDTKNGGWYVDEGEHNWEGERKKAKVKATPSHYPFTRHALTRESRLQGDWNVVTQ